MERFPDQESCIAHLERIRWRGTPVCPHCGCIEVVGKKEEGVGRVGRWNCYACQASFKVTCSTVFHGTKIALQKWFLAISLMANAKKSLSSHQLARDLDLNQKTAWYMMTRIRAEMGKKDACYSRVLLRRMKYTLAVNLGSPTSVKTTNPRKEDGERRKHPFLARLNVEVRLSHKWQKTSRDEGF